MRPFFFALVAAALTTLAGREAVRVARLSASLGRAPALLVAASLACLVASLVAARLGAAAAAGLAPEARTVLVGIALVLAAAEVLVLRPGHAPAEPTRSFGAVLLVLVAEQLTAAAAVLVFALAGASGAPWLAAAGGGAGSGAVLAAAWSMGARWEARMPLGPLRYAVAGLLLAAAVVMGLPARALP